MGVIAGIGCGLGYISPVSTLVKWFPDRRGMATGMAIMGFGGGAFIAGYLNVFLMELVGVERTVIVLGAIYFVVMLMGARILRQPPEHWRPEGWHPPAATGAMILEGGATRDEAIRTVQFYLLWGILFINVTAGIGILAQASPMMQDMFGRTPFQAAAIVSIISIFNATGRLFWASTSDYIGRRNTYLVFFVVQFVLFLLIPGFAASGNWLVFQVESLPHLHDVRRRLRHHPGVSRRHLRPAQRRSDSRGAADRVERRGRRRSRDHHRALESREGGPGAGRRAGAHLRRAAAGARRAPRGGVRSHLARQAAARGRDRRQWAVGSRQWAVLPAEAGSHMLVARLRQTWLPPSGGRNVHCPLPATWSARAVAAGDTPAVPRSPW